MTSFPRSDYVITTIVITVSALLRPVPGCFQDVEPIVLSKTWAQATGVHSYFQYVMGAPKGSLVDTIMMYPREKQMGGTIQLKCLRTYSSNQALVEITGGAVPSGSKDATVFQCIRFQTLSEGILRLSKTQPMVSRDEANCNSNEYTLDPAILVEFSDHPARPSRLVGSYQAQLSDPTKSDFPKPCESIVRFHCHKALVSFTFGSSCKPPVFNNYANKPRGQKTVHLTLLGEWDQGGKEDEDSTKTVVLRQKDKPFSIWCFHYRYVNASDEILKVLISFDGTCMEKAFSLGFVAPKDTMHGHLASFVPASDSRCSDKFYLNQCQNDNVDCRTTNACPSQCQRCYTIPKTIDCNFPSQMKGQWELMNSTRQLTVDIFGDKVMTSDRGSFSCRPKSSHDVHPVVQYDKSTDCLPLYACANTVRLDPGVLAFSLRQTLVDIKSGKPLSCRETNSHFDENPTLDSQTTTLINEAEIGGTPCDIGKDYQFVTDSDDCLLNVSKCSGKHCRTLNVSLDNGTCHDSSAIVLPIAKRHHCLASFKFMDGIRGLLTYSPALDKYACWIFTSTRLFVTESYLCNDEGSQTVFGDKRAATKYDPIRAFTVLPVEVPASGSRIQFHSACVLVSMCLFWMNVAYYTLGR